RAESHLRDCDMLRGIEFVVDSHEVGIEKPDPAIFRLALDRLGVAAARALFVGDIRSVDEAGARGAGMPFVLLDPLGDYAGEGTAAIPGMDRLAAWVEAHFETAARAITRREGGTS
ncbi:MAG TPA: HAD-IA family hydrolase, partial [Candidatus Eisenbacteria bacterium]